MSGLEVDFFYLEKEHWVKHYKIRKFNSFKMCHSRKYPYSPPKSDWKLFAGGEGRWVLYNQNIQRNASSLIRISRGGGGGGGGRGPVLRKKSLPWWRYGYFLEQQNHYYLPQKVTIAPVDKTITDNTTLAIFTKTSLES